MTLSALEGSSRLDIEIPPLARYDGIHMFGPSGQKAFTDSVMKILSSAQLVKVTPPKYYDQFDHQNSQRGRYQTKQENRNKTLLIVATSLTSTQYQHIIGSLSWVIISRETINGG